MIVSGDHAPYNSLAGELNSVVGCTVMTNSRQDFVICDLRSRLAMQGIIVGALSLLVSAI